ncbi:MAG: uncharacterized protein JWR69_2970 [Pedosphaera sp.]|nr:uncharacterized protein [Pedosphaera sp.]
MDVLPTVVNKPAIGHKAPFGLRTVAIFEFVKGFVVLVAGFGCLTLLHTDVQAKAESIVHWLRIDPAWRYAQIFFEEASKVTDTRLLLGAGFAVIYAVIRFVETYGLWHERHWAEWFAVISAGLYIPLEIYHLWHRPSPLAGIVFLTNVIIVVYLGRLLAAQHRRKKAAQALREHR